MSFVLGIDGGGSKSVAAVSDGLSVLGTYTAGGCNLNSVPAEDAKQALAEAVQGALSSSGISVSDVSSTCAGISGAGSEEIASKIKAILAQLLPHSPIQIVPDTVIALEAAFSGTSGLVCISGTGSIAYGRNEQGEVARAGGWGHLLSDEGSGYWIGHRAVSQCLRALDMGRDSALISGVMEYWQIGTREQLLQRCHQQQLPDFAELFPIVLAAAESDDPLASEILSVAGVELAHITQIVLRRLWPNRDSMEIAITGGVFTNSARVRQAFCNTIRSDRPEVQVRLTARQPIEGALYLAHQSR